MVMSFAPAFIVKTLGWQAEHRTRTRGNQCAKSEGGAFSTVMGTPAPGFKALGAAGAGGVGAGGFGGVAEGALGGAAPGETRFAVTLRVNKMSPLTAGGAFLFFSPSE